MKISYFYNIRFFKPNQIPLSTAAWDPTWFHNYRGKHETFYDNRGVLNGLRIPMFIPKPSLHRICCGASCKESPNDCEYIKGYRKQLSACNIVQFTDFINELKQVIPWHSDKELEFILIVYEKPDNPCSERVVLQEWFAEHGITLEEFQRPRF